MEEPVVETVEVEEVVSEPEEEAEAVEEVVEEEEIEEEEEEVVEETTHVRHVDLEDIAAKNTYVSKFEKLADTSKPKQDSKPKKKKKKEDSEYKVRNKDLEKQIKQNISGIDVRPIYTDEELEEIEARELEEEEREYDFDYDEYEDYYDEDEN